MWSDELRKMTVEHFGECGKTMLKTVENGRYRFAAGFDSNIFIPDRVEALIPESEKGKRYFLFSVDDGDSPESFLKAYEIIEDLVDDGWVID